MFARNLEHVLHLLTAEGDFRPYAPRDIEERFKSLRGYGKLPRGREKRGQHLSPAEIASAILGLVPANPAWAGHAVAVLEGLRPVGSIQASFEGAATLAGAVKELLTDEMEAGDFRDLSLSAAAFGTNNSGFAALRWQRDGAARTTHFISELAVSLMQPSAEKCHSDRLVSRLWQHVRPAHLSPAWSANPTTGSHRRHSRDRLRRATEM